MVMNNKTLTLEALVCATRNFGIISDTRGVRNAVVGCEEVGAEVAWLDDDAPQPERTNFRIQGFRNA